MGIWQRLRSSNTVQAVWGFLSSQNYAAIFLIVILVIAIRLPIDYKRIMTVTDNDYGTHIQFALDMLHGRPVPSFTLAHSFWQLFLIFMWWLSRSRIDFWQSAIGLQVASSVAFALIVYFWYGAVSGKPSAWKRAFWAVTLVIVAPVIAPQLLGGNYYFGYIGLANYHNPTVHVLRPFAVVMFIFAMEVLRSPRHSFWLVLLSAGVTASATFLKPSYTITLFPAFGLMVLYWLIKRRPIDWWLLIFGLGLPAILLLAPQYVVTYLNGETDGGIAFMPLVAARMMSGYLPVKFLMSILFPTVIAAIFFQRARQDHELTLAWLSFLMGASQFYLLAELGSRATHGNFLWGAQITLVMLFVVTIRFLLKQEYDFKNLTRPNTWVQYAVYLPHIASGIAYYIFCYMGPHYG